ncbi:uncharacterized protein GGS22DRAFT_190749 [Annulohypoxylon maeteangense]|uniref:uncharacterized protein n=1 Tax=Annulohypoxylon maeteangense TaxID=1927788 RepID=UPI0020073753|nr:uncharacterized protein GGS22DRAFT_190749 [Annulohypoxylon maeteangense]KAI0882769.1 hypothetical protein GGS22DRAFT_190749 [Annulohypoxylon maeteangense]
MPSVDIKQIVDTKPLAFTIKTGGGRWQCQIHKDRASYERARVVRAPGISRTDSGLSTSSTSSTSSKASF